MDREKQIEKQLKEKCDLVDVISYAMRDFDDYLDECHEEEIPPIDTCEDFIADSILSAGYRKQSEGEWVRKDGFLVCSNCDSTKPFAVIRDEIHYYGCDYCNKCGAKMKGGAE